MGGMRVRIGGVEEIRPRSEVAETDRPREVDAPAGDRGRPRLGHLETAQDEARPPGTDERIAEFKERYKEGLAAADPDEVQLPDELSGLREEADERRGPGGDEHRGEPPDRVRAPGESDAPDEAKLRIDRPESNDPYKPRWQENRYDADALNQPDGQPKPLFDGRPKREDTKQGDFGDCGIVASIGAVAGTAPDKIRNAMKENPDGSYAVTLHETKPSWPDGLAEPTGKTTTYTVSRDMPVHASDGKLAGMKADSAAWPAVMEKAIAGADQTWTPEQKDAWEKRWAGQKAVLDHQRVKEGKPPYPDGDTPTGYQRISQGSNAYDRADVLTMITGRQAEVRAFPSDDNALVKEIFADKLAYDKPVLVGSRARDRTQEGPFPNKVEASHAYEVTGLTRDGRIQLRNPWNERHPDPMTVSEFREYFSPKRPDGSRPGLYTTLS